FGKASIHDVETGEVRRSFGSEKAWNPVSSPDGSIVAGMADSVRNGRSIALWETTTGNLLAELKREGQFVSIEALRFSPDGLSVYFQQDGKIYSWDLKSDKPKELTTKKGVLNNVLSPDGRLVAMDTNNMSPELLVVDVASGVEKKTKASSIVVGDITFFP